MKNNDGMNMTDVSDPFKSILSHDSLEQYFRFDFKIRRIHQNGLAMYVFSMEKCFKLTVSNCKEIKLRIGSIIAQYFYWIIHIDWQWLQHNVIHP